MKPEAIIKELVNMEAFLSKLAQDAARMRKRLERIAAPAAPKGVSKVKETEMELQLMKRRARLLKKMSK